MGRYVKKICPNCNYVIQNYKLDNTYGMIDIGIPFEICPQCQTILIKKNIKEINMMSKIDYIKIWLWNISSGIILGGLFSLFLSAIIINLFNLKKHYGLIMLFTFITTFGLYLYKCNRTLTIQKEKSEERLKNKEYHLMIEKIFFQNINADIYDKDIKKLEDDGLIPKNE